MQKITRTLSNRFSLWSNFTIFFSCFVLAFFCITLAGSTAFAKPAKDPSGKKRILVQYRAGLSEGQKDKSHQRYKKRITRHIRGINARVMELSTDEDVADVIKRLSKDPHVKFAEEDRLVPAEAITTNDPYAVSGWHLEKIQAPIAWETSLGDNIVVAVLDTGIDENHPDLVGQIVPGWNIYDGNTDTADVYGHGTSVAGTIAAASNNGIGVTSIAWNSLIMPVRISGPDGYAFISDIADGITWAADHGAQVANISYDVSTSPTIQSAAAYMRERGGVVVVSAGNSAAYRSSVPNQDIITVGATNSTDVLAGFSTYGEHIDLVAPGVTIWTTAKGGGYTASSGTSFSSPVVAAVAALMMTANPILDPEQIHMLLNETADDLGDPGVDIYFGSGRVNAATAVEASWSLAGVDSLAPTVTIASPTGGTVSGIVPIDVSASDDISVNRVELYVNGTLVGTETAAPYVFSWDSTTLTDGPATLVAHAFDAAENQGISSAVMIEVKNADTVAPTVTIVSPTGGTIAESISIDVSATDNFDVTRVELFLNGKLLGVDSSAPYAFSWDSTSVSNGPATLVAHAFDAAGNQGISSAVMIEVKNVDTVAPTVTIVSPTGGTIAESISIDVSATDNFDVTRVELFLNGKLFGVDSSAPYAFSWDSTNVSNGPATLVAHAFDAAGNQGISSTVMIEVKNVDTVAPTVTIVSPTGGIVSDSITIDVNASDNVSVSHVVLYVNGSLLGRDMTVPYVFNWDSTTATNGSVTLIAYAYDAAGNQGVSTQVVIDVKNVQIKLTPGDLDDDGDVDYKDYRVFIGTYNLTVGDSGYLPTADYNGDGLITYADFRIWYGYYRNYVYGS